MSFVRISACTQHEPTVHTIEGIFVATTGDHLQLSAQYNTDFFFYS